MTAMPNQRQRIAPTAKQTQSARHLLDQVPTLSYDWVSAPGKEFLAYVRKLVDNGVPVAWIAEPLGVDPARLYAALARHRRGAA